MRHSPFFLTGAPKSGTTWLGKLLDAHPEITCRGEARVHHFGIKLVGECKTYNEMLAKRREVVTDANDFPPMSQNEIQTLLRAFIELRLNAIVDPGKDRLRFLGEKDPEHCRHFKVIGSLFPEAKFINIIRDGRGVFISSWHHNARSNDVNLERFSFDEFLDITAKQWAEYIHLARKGAKLIPGRYFEVRYEDLVADPRAWMKRTLEFLGASTEEETIQACIEAASFEKLSQGRKAGEEDTSSFFRKGDPADWRNHLSAAQIQRFNAHSEGLLEELGYEI